MADEDYWLPVRRAWDAQISLLLDDVTGPRPSSFVIKPRLNLFADPDVAIAIMGMRGTGKSTLLKALRRRLRLGGYEQRGESPTHEPDRFVAHTVHGKKQVQVVVVPGQKDSDQGGRTIRKYFENGRSPSGVVHVVSWGYSTIWDTHSESYALGATTVSRVAPGTDLEVERMRAYNLKGELDDFRQTRKVLQTSWRTTAKPLWLVIAVTKADLFRDAASAKSIRDHYIPAANPTKDGAFARELRGLVNHVGQHRFDSRISVLPLVSFLEDYPAGSITVRTKGSVDLVSTLMTNFSNRIGEFCGGEA